MKKFFGVVLALGVLILSGCAQQCGKCPPGSPAEITPVNPEQQTKSEPSETPSETVSPPETDTVPQPPKIQQKIDWKENIQPLVEQMLQVKVEPKGSILLLDSIKNNTNGSLQVGKANPVLRQALAANPVFTLVSESEVNSAKQSLGLSVDDSLGSRSKAIGLARIVGAQYVLYSTVKGDVKAPILDMQLMLVQTGEIVWSGKSEVK